MPQYRLTFDIPYSFATEPGYQGGRWKSDFSQRGEDYEETWRCPVTGIVMLKPNILKANYYQSLMAMEEFRRVADFWREVKRSIIKSKFFQSLKPAGKEFTLIKLLVDITPIAIAAAATFEWMLETKDQLAVDESFVVYYRAMQDERVGRDLLLCIQWDDIGIYLDGAGTISVYQYDRANMAAQPVKTYEFNPFDPGEIYHRDLYFWFLPMPGIGLVLYHNLVAQNLTFVQASSGAGVTRGTLIPWSARSIDGDVRLFDASTLRIGARADIQHQFGVQRVRFSASGTFTDAAFDPGFKPTLAPALVQGVMLEGGHGAISAVLRNANNTGDWEAGTDRQGRIKCTLTCSDSLYTPFLVHTNVLWNAVFTNRDTTPWQAERIFELEYSEDEWRRFEGRASVLIREADGQVIAQRGDMTFLLERSLNGGVDWETVFGGLTKVPELELIADGFGTYYRGSFQLNDLYERMRESHLQLESGLDGQTLPDAINNVLGSCGLNTIPTDSFPASLQQIVLPANANDSSFRFAPRQGDNGEEILGKLLLFALRQNEEYCLWWNWDTAAWVIERKPHPSLGNVTTWSLATRVDRKDASANRWYYQAATWKPEAPEANLFKVQCTTQTDDKGKRLIASASNQDSIDNPSSPDYLGRVVSAMLSCDAIAAPEDLNLMAVRLLRAAGYRRDKLTLNVPAFQDALAVMTEIVVERDDETALVTAWLKKRTVMTDQDEREKMILELDSVWEGEISVS